MPDYIGRRAIAMLNEQGKAVNGSRVLLLGLAYKKNTGDARESPAVRVAELLAEMGADLCAADPHVLGVLPGGIRRAEVSKEELVHSDLVIVLTDHDAFPFELVISTQPTSLTHGEFRRCRPRPASD